jgi:molecular chaperone GrpE
MMFKKRSKMKSEDIHEGETENVINDSVENDNVENIEINSEEIPTEELSPLEQKEKECKELHDKYIRLFSEFDNYRKRTAKEKIDLRMTAGGDIIKEMLPIVDDFDRAIANNANSEDIEAVKEGFGLIQTKMMNSLKAKGLVAMESQGEVFDVNKHEALTQIPAPSEDLKGKVVDVIEKGFLLNDKVLRFAKVVVGQ